VWAAGCLADRFSIEGVIFDASATFAVRSRKLRGNQPRVVVDHNKVVTDFELKTSIRVSGVQSPF
jgi:hypothetical protein